MRICYYNRLLNEPRGCGVHGRSLVENWQRQGHEVLCLPHRLAAPGPELKSGVRDLSALPPFVRAAAHEASARLRAAKNASRFAQLISDFAPDLIVTRRAGYDYCLDGVLAKTSLPYVVEGNAIASLEVREFEGDRVLPWEHRRELRYLRRAAGVVCVTPELQSRMMAVGVPKAKTAVLPNGVDVQLFAPGVVPDEATEQWSRGHGIVFGFVGSQLCSLHDLAGLMKVAGGLVAEGQDIGLLFVGPTRSEIEETGLWPDTLVDRMFCTGRVAHAEVAKYLVCADVLWASFRNDYGSPLKLYEYMAMAKPVLVAGAGEAVEAVRASDSGKTVDRGDDEGLLRCALELCRASAGERSEMGANGRAWVMKGRTWADVAARFIDHAVAMLAKA